MDDNVSGELKKTLSTEPLVEDTNIQSFNKPKPPGWYTPDGFTKMWWDGTKYRQLSPHLSKKTKKWNWSILNKINIILVAAIIPLIYSGLGILAILFIVLPVVTWFGSIRETAKVRWIKKLLTLATTKEETEMILNDVSENLIYISKQQKLPIRAWASSECDHLANLPTIFETAQLSRVERMVRHGKTDIFNGVNISVSDLANIAYDLRFNDTFQSNFYNNRQISYGINDLHFYDKRNALVGYTSPVIVGTNTSGVYLWLTNVINRWEQEKPQMAEQMKDSTIKMRWIAYAKLEGAYAISPITIVERTKSASFINAFMRLNHNELWTRFNRRFAIDTTLKINELTESNVLTEIFDHHGLGYSWYFFGDRVMVVCGKEDTDVGKLYQHTMRLAKAIPAHLLN